MGKRLTVLVGRGPLSAAIRQTLEDLAALNLVVDYLWVDLDAFHSSASLTSCVFAAADGTADVQFLPLNQALTRTRATGLSLGVINDVASPAGVVSSDQLTAFIEAIDAVDIGRRAPRTNLMLAAFDSHAHGQLPILRGYNNLMLAPEDSIGPEVTPVAYAQGDLGGRYTLHCATGIASLFGIWEGHADTPVLQMDPAHGETFRLVRAFYRRIDGQEVQQKLKEQIFATGSNPLPLLDHPGQRITAQHPTDYRTFNRYCADELIREFDALLKGPRVHGAGELTRQQTNKGAASEFARAYTKNLITAPVRWFDHSSGELSQLTSQAIQSSLYGTDSKVQVGAGPYIGQDNPKHLVAQRINREQVAREYSPLWQSYENMALTMMDAQPRPFGSSPIPRFPTAVAAHETAPVYVAPAAETVIPGPNVRFGNDLPPQLKSMLGMDSIASYDVMEAERYEHTLSQQANFQHRDIGRIIGEFGHWRNQHSGSFAANVSSRLCETVRELEQEATGWQIRAKQLRNQRAESPKTSAAGIAALRWLGYVTFWSWASFTGLWAVLRTNIDGTGLPAYHWVRAFEMSATSTKVTFLGLWFLLWMLLFMWQVALKTRDEIRVLNRRRTIISDIEAADKNYLTCVEAQERIKIGYHQFVSLSHQLGAVLESPFGTVHQYRVDNVIPANDMPESVLLAEAAPDQTVVEDVARRYRALLYHQGWAQGHVHEARELAAELLEQQAGIPPRTANMHSLTGRGTGTVLDTMGQLMASPEFNALDRSQDEWAEVTTQLQVEVRGERAAILQPMCITRGGRKINAPVLQPLDTMVNVGSFNAEFITDTGRIHSVNEVDRGYFHQGGSDLDVIGASEVLVQVSKPARAEDIRIHILAPIKPPAPNAFGATMPGEGEF